jgi:hypothetical protein
MIVDKTEPIKVASLNVRKLAELQPSESQHVNE